MVSVTQFISDDEPGIRVRRMYGGKLMEVMVTDWKNVEDALGRSLTRDQVAQMIYENPHIGDALMVEAVAAGVAVEVPQNVTKRDNLAP